MSGQEAVVARCIAALEAFGKSTGHVVQPFDSLDKDEQEFFRDAVAAMLDAAAAPELLEALEHITELFVDSFDNAESERAVINARAAIAKATGEA